MKRTKEIDLEKHYESVMRQMKNAARKGEFDGRLTNTGRAYMNRCGRADVVTCTKLIFTRDTGHHTSGWFKNPDYERCLHLSMSPIPMSGGIVGLDGMPLTVGELDKKTEQRWVKAFYRDCLELVWAESPKSAVGKQASVWHWRVFCDEHWEPILPRDEVYSREFIEKGWRSASQVFEEDGVVVDSVLHPG